MTTCGAGPTRDERYRRRATNQEVVEIVDCSTGNGGQTTSKNAAIGPRIAVNRNHAQAERLRVRAYPAARIATVSHIAETIDESVANSCMT